ncbi:hypothetical protein BDU57DRAFT_511812 [Ampelomyces quisqualis]|uniref:Uncharacterized protein n=1 Tax=Ampelomyces quisqualis TaxID=50730 RepID=A0A6A5QWN5_AMPQU|nr:hypothetical protein BDU57DRAFT_511812 [Ampelomyces quisqualis]
MKPVPSTSKPYYRSTNPGVCSKNPQPLCIYPPPQRSIHQRTHSNPITSPSSPTSTSHYQYRCISPRQRRRLSSKTTLQPPARGHIILLEAATPKLLVTRALHACERDVRGAKKVRGFFVSTAPKRCFPCGGNGLPLAYVYFPGREEGTAWISFPGETDFIVHVEDF